MGLAIDLGIMAAVGLLEKMFATLTNPGQAKARLATVWIPIVVASAVLIIGHIQREMMQRLARLMPGDDATTEPAG